MKVEQGPAPTIDRARGFCQEGEYERALSLLTLLLESAPQDPEATKLSRECHAALERECLSAIGSESAVLVPSVGFDELKRFGLDNVSGYLVSLMDGKTSVGTILDITSLPRSVAFRHLRDLLTRGLVVANRSTEAK